MDPARFDALAKVAATTRSRRGLLKSLGGTLLGGLVAARGGVAMANKGGPPPDRGACAPPGADCAPDLGRDCCNGTCCSLGGSTGTCCLPPETCVPEDVGPGYAGRPPFTCCRSRDLCVIDDAGYTVCCGDGTTCVPGHGCCNPGTVSFGGTCTSVADCCGAGSSVGCQGGTCCSYGACAADGDCCDGRRCMGGECCAGPGQPCPEGECGLCCGGGGADGVCTCSPLAQRCALDADCCEGTCISGLCRAPCQPAETSCTADADCCTGATCQQGVCTALQPPPG